MLLAVTFVSLFLVAANEVRNRRVKKKAQGPPAPDVPAPPATQDRVASSANTMMQEPVALAAKAEARS